MTGNCANCDHPYESHWDICSGSYACMFGGCDCGNFVPKPAPALVGGMPPPWGESSARAYQRGLVAGRVEPVALLRRVYAYLKKASPADRHTASEDWQSLTRIGIEVASFLGALPPEPPSPPVAGEERGEAQADKVVGK